MIDKWFLIGVQLGLSEAKLRQIEADYHSVGRCFSEVISFWLNGNTEVAVSWKLLVEVLESPFVDEKGLAKKLREKRGLELHDGNATPSLTGMHSFCRYDNNEMLYAMATLYVCCTYQLIDLLHSDNQSVASDQSAQKSENSVVQLVSNEGTFMFVPYSPGHGCSCITPCFSLYWALTMCKIETQLVQFQTFNFFIVSPITVANHRAFFFVLQQLTWFKKRVLNIHMIFLNQNQSLLSQVLT